MVFIRSRSKGALSYFLIFLLVFTLFSVTGPLRADVSHAANEVTVSSGNALSKAVSNLANGEELTVRLGSDIVLNAPAGSSNAGIIIKGNKTINLYFDGHNISSSNLDNVIDIEEGSSLILNDTGEVSNTRESGKAFTATGSLSKGDGLCLRFYSDNEGTSRVTEREDGKIVRSLKRYTITLAPGNGGVINNTSGKLIVSGGKTKSVYYAKGETAVYKAVPETGRYISSIKVDGENQDVKYKKGQKITVSDINKNQKIAVSFEKYKYKITSSKETTSKGNGGTITKTCYVKYGNDKTFKIVPKFGYDIKKVYVDGKSVGRRSSYTFKNVKQKHTIKAVFKKVNALRIMLDAGHVGYYNRYVGKFDGKYYYESLMAWQLHKYLKQYLEKYNNVVVDTTRTSLWRDMDVYARGYKAKGYDLFLSLHSNSSPSSSTDYPLVIRQLGASDSEKDLAVKFAKNIKKTMGCRQDYSVWTRYYRENGRKVNYYGVLRGSAAAGCNGYILEHSFHTNRKMALWLYKKSNLSKMAKREAAIIAEHYGLRKKDGTTASTPSDPVVSDPTPYRAKITSDSVIVHKKAGSSYKQIGTLKKGDIYTIFRLSSSGNWGKLSCDNSGWILIKHTKKVSSSTDVTDYTVKKTVNEYLNIRKGPGTNYSIIGKINSSKTKYAICSENKSGTWGKLKNRKGWISLDCVKRVY